MGDIVLINPRFQVSYWGLEHALPLLGKKCNLPTACLPLIAALTPAAACAGVSPVVFSVEAAASLGLSSF